MKTVDVDGLKSWIRYSCLDDELKVSVEFLRKLVEEIELSRRVIGYAILSKSFLRSDGYTDIIRELDVYLDRYSDEDSFHY